MNPNQIVQERQGTVRMASLRSWYWLLPVLGVFSTIAVLNPQEADGATREGITVLSRLEMSRVFGRARFQTPNARKCKLYGGALCGLTQVPGQGEDACEEAGACIGPGDACGFGTVHGPSNDDICVISIPTDWCQLGVGWCQKIRRHICVTHGVGDNYICLCEPDPDPNIQNERIGRRNYCLLGYSL